MSNLSPPKKYNVALSTLKILQIKQTHSEILHKKVWEFYNMIATPDAFGVATIEFQAQKLYNLLLKPTENYLTGKAILYGTAIRPTISSQIHDVKVSPTDVTVECVHATLELPHDTLRHLLPLQGGRRPVFFFSSRPLAFFAAIFKAITREL